ncbi:MAG: hypothetical protein JXM71_11030 [Spirochaetales bacterium]|nr:hypothetical protein [Spirochaetales bacterium]
MKLRVFPLILSFSLLFTSCIGIDADARVGADGSVEASLVYTVSTAVDEIGRLGSNAADIPLPVGRQDLELAASRAGGELVSWSRDDGPEAIVVNTSLRFPTVTAFALFLDPTGESARYTEAGGTSTLTLRLYEGANPAEDELIDFIKSAFSDYAVSLRLEFPRTPAASEGFVVSGRTAVYEIAAADLYASTVPVFVQVSW